MSGVGERGRLAVKASMEERAATERGAMVEMPSAITVEGLGATDTAEGRWVAFRALTAEGHAAVRDGRLLVDD